MLMGQEQRWGDAKGTATLCVLPPGPRLLSWSCQAEQAQDVDGRNVEAFPGWPPNLHCLSSLRGFPGQD